MTLRTYLFALYGGNRVASLRDIIAEELFANLLRVGLDRENLDESVDDVVGELLVLDRAAAVVRAGTPLGQAVGERCGEGKERESLHDGGV